VNDLGPGSISACIVARNEEAVIGRCLESVAGVVDETILVHSGPCDDRTLEIAERFGCRVFVAPDWGYGEPNRPLAYERARGEWLLHLDADEFLSPQLRDGLRQLTLDPDVAGYAFIWPLWDGRRYRSSDGPYKPILFRRSRTRMVGLIHAMERVDGTVLRVPLVLEHRPAGPFALRSLTGKWRYYARIQARQYTGDLAGVPCFNCPGAPRWTRRRRIANALSPILVVPAGLHSFVHVLRTERDHLRPLENLRYAAITALSRAMVTAYVARFVYLRREMVRP
jgi:glycosyltransferase involved in cell wall biosynthesis